MMIVPRRSHSSPGNVSAEGRETAGRFEADAWTAVGKGWRPLFGRFADLGVSFEWHEFDLAEPLDWSRSFHESSLELCLNLSGDASVTCAGQTADFRPLTAGFYLPGDNNGVSAVRQPGQSHRFLTVELSRHYLIRQLGKYQSGLHPLVRSAVTGDHAPTGVGPVEPLTPVQVELVNTLRTPPVAAEAQRLWFEGKAGELMAHLLFRPEGEGFFCTRQHRLARERANRVVEILSRDLAEPPALELIGKEIGCSHYYLSRTFSSETGLTIPQYLRKLRMERSAELLRSGRCNVTEAAMEVGYSSLSHFSSAFQETFGCCPGLYPIQGYRSGKPGK
jgi:AraC family transcriptional regulator